MNHSLCNRLFRAAIPFGLAVLASVANAQQGGTAKGTLTVAGDNAPLTVKLMHAYYITGPDSFDPTNMERIIVFTAADKAAVIAACATKSCAELSAVDSVRVNLADLDLIHWWAHAGSFQYDGFSGTSLTLGVDTPQRLAGRFRASASGAAVEVEFDTALVKAFDR